MTGVNDAPELFAPTSVNVKSGANVLVRNVSVSDVDVGETFGAMLETTITPSSGAVSVTRFGGLNFVAGSGGGGASAGSSGSADNRSPTFAQLHFFAAQAATNQALASLAYHATGACGTQSITIVVNDGGYTGASRNTPGAPLSATKMITVHCV